MREIVSDQEVDSLLEAIQPQQVMSYLDAHGWSERRQLDDKAVLWQHTNASDKRFEVLLPLDRGLLDFPLRMDQALYNIALAEQRSRLAVLRDIATSLSDIIRVRVNRVETSEGAIPIDDGVLLLRSARDAMLAAACSTIEPRAFYPNRKFEQAIEYLKHVNLGQTERGSYIVTLVSPLTPPQTLPDVKMSSFYRRSDLMPFGRRVMRTFTRALMTIQEATEWLERLQDQDYRDTIIQNGVSTNFCEALVGMSKSTADMGLEFGLTWSSTLSIPDAPNRFYLPASLTPAIAKIGEQLSTVSQENYELFGQVVRLERERRDRVGIVTIEEVAEGERPRRVRVQLNDEDYARALQANQERRPVVCYGTLTRGEGHRPELKDCRGFHLIETSRSPL